MLFFALRFDSVVPGLAIVGTNARAPKLNQELLASIRAKSQELKLKLQALRRTQHSRRKDLEQQLQKLHERAELHRQTNGRLSQVTSILFAIPSYSIYLLLRSILLCLSYSIMFYPILPYSMIFYLSFIVFRAIVFHHILSCSILSCPIRCYSIRFNSIRLCSIMFDSIRFDSVLFCSVLFCCVVFNNRPRLQACCQLPPRAAHGQQLGCHP